MKLAEQSEHELYRSNQAFWFKKLDEEIDNFRMAIEWAQDTNVEAGLRIISSPWRFWDTRGYLPEFGDWLRRALDSYDTPNTLRARALAVYSLSNFQQGNFPETIKLAEQSLQLARTLSDKQVEAYSLAILGVFTLLQGKVDDGIPYLEESLALNKGLGDKPGQADIFGLLSNDSSDIERAVSYAREGLNLCRELGNLSGVSQNLDTLARLTLWRRDFSSPVPWLEEALSIARHLGDQKREVYILGDYGLLEYWQGNYEQATAYFKQGIQLSEKIGDRFQSIWAHVHLALAFLREGDVQQAHALFAKSIRDTQKADLFIALVFAVEGLASLHVTQDKYERAARLFAWADTMREKIGDHRPPVEQNSIESDLAVIHSQLDDDEYSKLCVEGQALTMDQAIALALEEA